MLGSVSGLIAAAIILQGTAPAMKSWIADIKAKRETLGATEVRLEGDVVDIRSTSPSARAGYYRLIDTSDPEGVLIRTGRLPRDGGALRVVARKAPQQPPDGLLLLDELDQARLDRRSAAPIVLGAISLTSFLVLVVLLIRAGVEERRYKLTPPLWLLPEAGPYGKTALAVPNAPPPPLRYSPELEEADQVHREQLRKRKRNLFHAVIGSFGLTGSSAAWLLITQPVSAQVPAFIFIEANDTPIPIVPSRPVLPDSTAVQAALDSLLRLVMPAPSRTRDTGRGESVPAVNPFVSPPPARPPAGPEIGPIRDSLPAAAPAPAPAPRPAPPPAPPEIVRDPEAERAAAGDALGRAAARLVDAINSRRMTDLAQLVPEALAGDLGRRERFMKLIRDYAPRASLGQIEGTALADAQGEARFTLQLAWRGDFGVQTRKAGRFLGLLHREAGGSWRFDGARLLDPLP